ncbi:TetR/AcrR family transcriptional regulator [Kitasatospora acidiphila]|uniref:TetR/AcrR family transcriptional regulator n=1 Tax=Kitasatospora acidiphila TaxID=2567942 RepID=A0A540WCJ9_9ACTN|nr:TetR family transcriptional regulator [Kitasatospora acidiphila]TQF06672.1 TetR/AcrR family transcriptional regulator [Kitasatospora acidiphila]
MIQEHQTSPRRSADTTRAAILRSARERFAAHGYERTTIRAVAADAGIDPSMVMRYFGSKEQLFDTALAIDLQMPDYTAVPRAELAEAVVRHFLERWEGAAADDPLLITLRSAVTNERAAERLHEVFARQVAPSLAAAIGPETAARMAGVLAAQLLGLALSRYLIRLPAIAALTPDQLVARLAPAIRATLDGDGSQQGDPE